MLNSYQRTTKNGRPLQCNGVPSHSLPVDMRIKNLRKQLNQGLSKFDSTWDDITRSIRSLQII